jgi:hypothetical protein
MHQARSRSLAQIVALSALVLMLLLCLAVAPLAGAAARPIAVELPIWFGTTLLVKAGPAANCPTPFACAVMSVVQRPGLSAWLIVRSPERRMPGWQLLLFLAFD